MMNKVEWKIKGLFKADAQKCYEEIGKEGASVSEILEKARNPETELHKCFEWDDSVAGEKYRLQQAGQICRNMVIIPIQTVFVGREKKEEEPVRVYQVTSERKGVYRNNNFFVEHVDEHEKLIKRARIELEAFSKRYNAIAELENVNEAIAEFLNS